jgi:TonB family protein
VPATPQALPPPRGSSVKGRTIAAALLMIAVLVGLVAFFSRSGFSGGKSGTTPLPPASEQAAPQSTPQTTAVPKPNPAREPAPNPNRSLLARKADVVRQVVPDVSKNSRNTIRGTIKVTVQVEADPSGKVTAAILKNAGPSKYFGSLALNAAQRWEFSPPQVNGQAAASTWLLQFRFKRSGTQAWAEPVLR